jgi:hypothetical protein
LRATLNAASERIFSLGPLVLRRAFAFAALAFLPRAALSSLDAVDANVFSSFYPGMLLVGMRTGAGLIHVNNPVNDYGANPS